MSSIEAVVDLARRAPSVHNTQPWTWARTAPDELELWADRSRELPVSDPGGRNLVISCGAALHHALVAGRVLGWAADVDHLPSPTEPGLLARLRLRRSRVASDAAALRAAIEQRCTDRRRFTAWPVPEQRVHELVAAARGWGVTATSVASSVDRLRVELLGSWAAHVQREDDALHREQLSWIDHGPDDGLPHAALVHDDADRPGSHHHRFDHAFPAPSADPAPLVVSTDGLLVIGTADDGVLSWLHAGAALSALWLRATTLGLSVVPLTQVVEVAACRQMLRHDVLGDLVEPHLLVRIGWQEIGRSDLPRTPRRSLGDVLRADPVRA